MALTDEQVAAVELFRQAKSLKISAFAGTGKTTTLVAVGDSTRRSGVYLAFNKAIATEASGKFPPTVDCRTTHSLALKSLPSSYRDNHSKIFDGLQVNRVVNLLSLEELAVDNVLLKPRSLGYLTARTIQRFCQSASRNITSSHVPITGKLKVLKPQYRDQFVDYLAKLAAHLWDRMLDPGDSAPLGHDGYLKLWSLNCPEMQYDFILLDEAQDTNEAVLSVLVRQSSQLTLVGDRHQQIYEWRGAVNAMAKVETAAEVALTRSFRFGPQIANIANQVLAQLREVRTVVGSADIGSAVETHGRTRAVLCRTNVGVIEVTLDALNRHERPYVVGGVVDLIAMLEDVTRLKRQVPADSPDLFGFSDWNEVVEFADSEDGEVLRTFVTIVNQNGEQTLIDALEAVSDSEGKSDLVISTGHKAKGREWASVALHTDFEPKKVSKDSPRRLLLNEEELRLLYVASTRAKQLLVVPPRLATGWGLNESNQDREGDTSAVQSPLGQGVVGGRAKVPLPPLPAIAVVVKHRSTDTAQVATLDQADRNDLQSGHTGGSKTLDPPAATGGVTENFVAHEPQKDERAAGRARHTGSAIRSDDGDRARLADLVYRQHRVSIEVELSRFRTDGWFAVGTAAATCPTCGTLQLEGYRKQYFNSRGDLYHYWALVCLSCKRVFEPASLDTSSKANLKKLALPLKRVQ